MDGYHETAVELLPTDPHNEGEQSVTEERLR